MSNLKNLSGRAGEFLCITEFMRATSTQRFLFDAFLLGGNAPTFDYIIYLVDSHGDRTGPFFFVQVKTTSKTPRPGIGYTTDFSASDVKRAQATQVPFFICAVDRSITGREKFFIKGVDARRTKGIIRMSATHDLATDAVKLALYKEVTRVRAAQAVPELKAFIRGYDESEKSCSSNTLRRESGGRNAAAICGRLFLWTIDYGRCCRFPGKERGRTGRHRGQICCRPTCGVRHVGIMAKTRHERSSGDRYRER